MLASSPLRPLRRTPTPTLNATTTPQRTPLPPHPSTRSKTPISTARGVYLSSIPDYAGNPYVILRADSTHQLDTPSFTLAEYEQASEEGCFKKFSKLDSPGRTRKALACVGPESLGQGKRGDISHTQFR